MPLLTYGGAASRPPPAARNHLASRRMDPAMLRNEFPVLKRLAYLNAGTDGPVPAAAVRAARAAVVQQS